MSTVFSDEASVFFVGGITTKVGDSDCGGCTKQWFDDNFTQLSDIMAADGGPKWEFSGISYEHQDGRQLKVAGTVSFTLPLDCCLRLY